MNVFFTHPAALWALAGIPAVVAIHFLQRRSRRQTITTLFLLQQMRRQSETGNRFERLRLSIPFWLQLLMVLLFAWLLAGPRWLRKDAVQRIAIVLDNSASMQAFRQAAEAGVARTLSTLTGPMEHAELTLWSSDSEAATLYHGSSAAELRAALRQWAPDLGLHDLTPALRAARALAGATGTVVLITDHVPAQALPFNAQALSVGQETANVGWAGVAVEQKDQQWFWRALVRNYSHDPQVRQWRAGRGNKVSAWSNLTLGPGETRSLSGPFVEDADGAQLMLSLSPDALALDDQMPVLIPRAKVLALQLPKGASHAAQELADLFGRFADCSEAAAGERADVRILTWPPSVALTDDIATCAFASKGAENAPYLQGQIIAEDHPLVQGLNWQSLLAREGMVIPRDRRDRVLLWQGERPLMSLRTCEGGIEQLFCHFDLATSNARKLPALAVLLHRFLERVRQNKVAAESVNVELHQRLRVAYQFGGPPLSFSQASGARAIPLAQAHLLRAPGMPGFFEVRQGEKLLLSGAAHFGDTREADLSGAKPFDELGQLAASRQEVTHEVDANWRLWLLLLLGALLASWWFATGQREAEKPAASLP